MRISDRFEQRFLTALGEVLPAAELREIDHEVSPVTYPAQEPGGGMSLALGMSVALSCPTIMIGDHALVMDLCKDPYIPDIQLKAWAGQMVAGLRRQRASANSAANGGALAGGGL
jgi:hypothetical protein